MATDRCDNLERNSVAVWGDSDRVLYALAVTVATTAGSVPTRLATVPVIH
jgi:hypothetical protein